MLPAELAGQEEQFASHLVEFGQRYGALARNDYVLFVDAFRNKQIADL